MNLHHFCNTIKNNHSTVGTQLASLHIELKDRMELTENIEGYEEYNLHLSKLIRSVELLQADFNAQEAVIGGIGNRINQINDLIPVDNGSSKAEKSDSGE